MVRTAMINLEKAYAETKDIFKDSCSHTREAIDYFYECLKKSAESENKIETLAAQGGVSAAMIRRTADYLRTKDYEFAAHYLYAQSCAVAVKGSRHEYNIRLAETRLGRKMF
jgi:hypothetical protein